MKFVPGKILIQTDPETHNPELYFLRLPRDIASDHVILMDASVATGAAAMMAIRILLDHDVKEENILLVSLLMAAQGVHAIAYAYPKGMLKESSSPFFMRESVFSLFSRERR